MTETPAAAPEIQVVGTRPHPSAPPRLPGVSGSVIVRGRIEQPGVSVADILREAPGVQVTQSGGLGAPATASLRGATAAQTPVYLAGVRINDEVGGVANLADVPPYFLERVEIYRSHAPFEASGIGLGGAVFFTPRLLRQPEMSLGTTFGSYGTATACGHVGLRTEQRQVLVGFDLGGARNDYEFTDSRGTLFDISDGGPRRLQNADAETGSFWFHARDQMGPGRVELLFNRFEREQGAPKLALIPTESARVRFWRELYVLRSELPIEGWEGRLALSTSATRAATILDDPQNELGLLTPRTETPGERVAQVIEARQNEYGRLRWVERLAIAVERLRRLERGQGHMKEKLAARRISVHPAIGAELHASDGLSFSAMAALQCFDQGQTDVAVCGRSIPTGRVGAVAAVGAFKPYGSVGRYVRLPTLSELYGASLLVRGNPELAEERGLTAELGVRFQEARPGRPPLFWVDVASFARRTRALITYVRTAQGYLHPVNRNSSRTLGGELSVGAHPLAGVELEGNLSLLDARDTSDDRVTKNDLLPFHSRATAFIRGRYARKVDFAGLSEAAVGARWSHQSSRYADPAGLGVIPAQSFTDLEFEVSALEKVLLARARISNLFDAARYDVVGFPLPGRSAFFSLEATW